MRAHDEQSQIKMVCLVKRTNYKQEASGVWTVSSHHSPPSPVTQLLSDRRVISAPARFHAGCLFFLTGIWVYQLVRMSLRLVVLLAVLTGVTGSPDATINADSADMTTPPNSVPDTTEGAQVSGQVRN